MDFSLENASKAKIFYYFREKYYNLMLSTCKECISKFKGNIVFHLYNALALILNNRCEEGIHDLDSIQSENDVKLSVTIALMYANKLLGVNNKTLYAKLDNEMREFRKSSEATDFYNSAFVLCVFNKYEKALDYIEKALALQSHLNECLSLKGWVSLQLYKGETNLLDSALDSFKTATQNDNHLDATLGVIEAYLFLNKNDEALNCANKAALRFTSTNLPLIYKMKVLLCNRNWEQVSETVNRILNTEPNNLDAIKMNILVILCKDGKYEEAVLCLRKLLQELQKSEPGNSALIIHVAQLFSRICGRNHDILIETYKIVENAVQNNPDNIDNIVELAYQNLLQGKIRESTKHFRTASKLDESSAEVLVGLTYCDLLQNNFDQVQQQVDYLSKLDDIENHIFYLLTCAKLANDKNKAVTLLNKACNFQLNRMKFYPYSEKYLLLLNPDAFLEVIREYFQYISSSSDLNKGSSSKSTVLDIPLIALQAITKACPALYEATYLLSKTYYLRGDMVNAMNILSTVLSETDESVSDAHLLMAQIHLQNGYFERASQSLEASLSSNFKIREYPTYHFIDGIVNKQTKNYPDAIKSFKTALSLINLRQGNSKEKNEGQVDITLSEKAQIYMELIDAYNLIGNHDEAAKLLEDATTELKGTSEESRILILTADQCLNRNGTQEAIDILNNVKETESYYLQARAKLAEIFLKYRRDKYAYLQCYKDMVEKDASANSYVLLGDACMRILEPDEALECYERALQQNPQDPFLTSKMGEALVETFNFERAINYYKETIKLTNSHDLKLQLADLYFQLEEYSQAEALLMAELESQKDQKLDDLTYLKYKIKLLQLLSSIQEKLGNILAALTTLKQARETQGRICKRLRIENSSTEKDTKLLVDIGVKLAELAVLHKDQDQAMEFYKETIEVSPNDVNVLGALAKLYIQMNYLELCQKTCTNILRIDPENDAALIMMADIAFHKVDFDMASFHFTQLVSKNPTNWVALARLVEILRRIGNLEEIQEYLKSAEDSCYSAKETGFLYCTALYQWYSGNLNGALRNFNLSRQDSEWGLQSIYNMIEICLNPNDDLFVDQVLENEDMEYRDSRSMALKTADRLLKELKQKLEQSGDGAMKYNLLQNFRLIATKEKYNLERALDNLITLASQSVYKDHVGIILGISTAHTLLKQQQRAKNQLKRIVKTQWTFEDAEYLERCWLLLADSYIQAAKYENAMDLLNKVVHYNKSCSKAYEHLGLMAEKEPNYKSATSYYESAWKYGGKTNASVGYKLAYCYMKNKQYANAIDVGQQVLRLNPEYSRVKKDILDKSVNNLRT